MSKQEYKEIVFSKKDYDELTKEVKKLGYTNIEEFMEKATRNHLEKLKREVAERNE